MNTLLNTERQALYLANNNDYSFNHKWSCRGDASSRLIMEYTGVTVAKANGAGYDRFGRVLGDLIEHFFMGELKCLAKRFAKKKGSYSKSSKEFYGLFLRPDGTVYLDGACGVSSMEKILNAIGFDFTQRANTGYTGQNGTEFYNLKPISKHARKYRIKPIK